MTYEQIKQQAETALRELLEQTNLTAGDIFIIGCSSSEIKGSRIGKGSDIDAAKAVYDGVYPILKDRGIYLAAQCCEHLNRAVIVEKAALGRDAEIVNVVPQLHAGGSFAVTVYNNAENPVAVEEIKADAGMDIGDTFIGMHLRKEAVPVRVSIKEIGEAHLTCARTRPKFIGGSRAVYDDVLAGGEIQR
ncbi:MAG: TIGR01440 family protein [Firmicutes bacterium]|nr:TIGR01440 family protein [Bacillota bacterium]